MDEKMNDLSPQMEEAEDDAVMSPDTYSEETEKIATEENEDATEDDDGFSEPIRESQIEDDMEELKKQFPELSGISRITELENPLRYGALRDLGLSPSEAYLATHGRKRISDNRYHLFASPAISASAHGAISEKEMEAARDIFPDISDKEIRKLYKKVTSNERKNYV